MSGAGLSVGGESEGSSRVYIQGRGETEASRIALLLLGWLWVEGAFRRGVKSAAGRWSCGYRLVSASLDSSVGGVSR